VSDAYAAAGVDVAEADLGVAGIGKILSSIATGSESLAVPLPGHYASVIKLPAGLADGVGIALATDSVGSKVIVAEQARRFDTIGIDCMAMCVNDLICVGARPLALLDYIAVEEPDPELLAQLATGLATAATQAGVEIPGGEVCQVPEVLRGHPSPYGFDLVGSGFGSVQIDRIVDGTKVAPGDALIGLPSAGVHSNGLTLARHALLQDGGLTLDEKPAELGGQSIADVLLEPTAIYVRAILELLGSDLDVHGLAHITGSGLLNLRRIGRGVGYRIDAPLPAQPVFDLIAAAGNVSAAEMWQVFNMGCGFVAFVGADDAVAATELLAKRHPGTAVIGSVSDRAGAIELPTYGVEAQAGSAKLVVSAA
jgi:phosphoribosylformylglycinamidine cyclo-ligase